MSTLLLRLASPLQSWGADSKFNRRETERAPTKSGIIGLIAAALGRQRHEAIDDLRSLRFGVRIDQEGTLLRDFHMVHEELFWKRFASKYAHLTNRYYLSDALFLVGLEGEDEFLRRIDSALQNPYYPLFLGRRSCPPEGRVSLGIRSGIDLLDALKEEPWLVSEYVGRWKPAKIQLRIITDAEENEEGSFFQQDDPLTFDQTHRKFEHRILRQHPSHVITNFYSRHNSNVATNHDPIAELEEV